MPSNLLDEELPSMPLLDHLTELRSRLIRAAAGFGIAYAVSLTFTHPLWTFVCRPAAQALAAVGYPPKLYVSDPTEGFTIIWVQLPLVLAAFLSAPWIFYQAWAFLAPGLYRNERRWAGGFAVAAALLFLGGGAFAYLVLFRYGLTFLLGIGRDESLGAVVSVSHYFGLLVNVVLGVGIMFELPMLIFLLTAVGLVTPRFLLRNVRYAVLGIFLLAAVITPTSDVANLTLLAGPMCALFALGIAGSYVLTREREGRPLPWRLAFVTAGIGGAGYLIWRKIRPK
jgi:sec-independent protein translocase protein TatC